MTLRYVLCLISFDLPLLIVDLGASLSTARHICRIRNYELQQVTVVSSPAAPQRLRLRRTPRTCPVWTSKKPLLHCLVRLSPLRSQESYTLLTSCTTGSQALGMQVGFIFKFQSDCCSKADMRNSDLLRIHDFQTSKVCVRPRGIHELSHPQG